MSKDHPLSRKDNIVVQELNGETLIYDLSANKALCLNQTSAFIWQLCDGTTSIAEIRHAAGKRFGTPASEEIVWLALDQLKKENLLVGEVPYPQVLDGLPRREIIKRIGLASLVALPVIMSVTAPAAAQAQSFICTSGLDSNNCFCLDSFCDNIANIGQVVPAANPGCQDGCTVAGTCTCKGPFICSGSANIPGTGVKTGSCRI